MVGWLKFIKKWDFTGIKGKPFKGNKLPEGSSIEQVCKPLLMQLSNVCDQPKQVFIHNRNEINALLTQLNTTVEALWDKTRSESVRNANDFFTGMALSEHAERVYDRLSDLLWYQEKILAADCWAKATLAVAGHYKHLVGPAMLAAADSRQLAGKPLDAKNFYQAVIDDFSILVEEWIDEETGPHEKSEDRQALNCLQRAISSWFELEKIEKAPLQTLEDYQNVRNRLLVIFEKPAE